MGRSNRYFYSLDRNQSVLEDFCKKAFGAFRPRALKEFDRLGEALKEFDRLGGLDGSREHFSNVKQHRCNRAFS